MKKNIQIFFVLLSFSLFATANATYGDKNTNLPVKNYERYYPAQEQEGFIGVFDEKPLDNPSDNIFKVSIDILPQADEEVWLTYELYGIENHTGISRSINDQLSVGGYIGRTNTKWQTQNEQIKADWLKKGNNVIRFTLPAGSKYNYRIKNLGIQIKRKLTSGRNIIVNQSVSQEYFNNTGYINGYIEGAGADKAKVFIDEVQVLSLASEFEALIANKNKTEFWESQLKVIFPDGEVISKKISFKTRVKAHYQNHFTIRSGYATAKVYNPAAAFNLSLKDASIKIEPQSLETKRPISITALREVDIPALNGTLVNVTKSYSGYRFLPHGTKFAKEAQITLGYDSNKIPEGYTEKDIKTYFFDEVTKSWVALKRDSINNTTQQIVSRTNHFTDMINGIIKVPESPETAGFTPTSIKDIKAANPSAAVNTIEPPKANNMGTANIGYPIVLPAGRMGMQPQLGVQYSSGGGNDWLGIGWNLQIPSISIDTRWGVPRYASALETETYTVGGMQLAPVAHKGPLVERTAEKQFTMRVEGSFNKIIRHGDNPANYWWEVTDKSGTVYSYGGTTASGIIDSSVLKDAEGNIAYWALAEIRDLNDNFVKYHCSKVMDAGVQGGSVPGQNIYIERITYTGHGQTEGKYEVLFTRDRELSEAKRTDVIINARYGFKQVTADLLRKIDVRLNGAQIRSYELTYKQGAFYKTLLEKITEFDASGKEFTQHEFEYFDDVNASEGYAPLSAPENWNPQDDGVKGNFINPLDQFNDDASALSGTKSGNFSFGLAVTFGVFDGNLFCKSRTLGGDFSYGESTDNGFLSLIDINGDGLPDKVFMNGDGFSYRPNQSGPDGITEFGELLPITGINSFYKNKSTTTSGGFQANAGCGDFSGFIGLNKSKSKSQTTVYFTDANADQLIDVAVGGQVFFNHIDENGNPVFTASSEDTPSAIFQNGIIDESIFTIDPQEIEDAIDQNPLHDVVRLWEAPFDGMITIDAPVNLLAPSEASGTADGVRVAIQLNGSELWNTTIAADDFTVKTPFNVSNVAVTKGDRIYFRVQSVFNGTDDLVNWNPSITYAEHSDTLVDANNLPVYSFNAGNDFLISSLQTTETPIDGTITIEGTFEKPVTSDDITAQIIKESDGTIVWEQNYSWDQTVTETISLSVPVLEGDSFSFRVNSDTNVSWADIKWTPRVYYTASADPDYPTSNLTDVNGNPTLEFYPVVYYTVFAETVEKTSFYEAVQDETISVVPTLTLNGTPSGKLVFTIKKVNELVAKQYITINNGIITGISETNLNLLAGERIFIEYHVSDPELLESVSQANATLTIAGNSNSIDAGLFTVEEEIIFGPQYRHWGQFAYNGNRERATQPINESELKLDDAFTSGNNVDLSGAGGPEELEDMYEAQGGYNPAESIFIVMIPDSRNERWQGFDDLTYITASSLSSSRMGQDDLSVVSPIPGNSGAPGSGASAITKISESKTTSFSLGGGVGSGLFGTSGSYSKSESETRVLSDFMDMNGDGYPDIVTDTHIQYTTATGGLAEGATPHNFGVNNFSVNESDGVTLGGTYTSPESKGTIYNVKNRTIEVGKGAGGGLSGNFAKGSNEIDFSWKDVNGDGLPDRVYEGGNVALNLGYKFAPIEAWGYVPVQEGKSTSYGAGLGINIGNNSIAGGISLSRSESEGEKMLQDVNGDGLVDELILANPVKVRINTGNGFGPEILWTGADAISENSTTSESANFAFTVCIPLPTPLTPAFKLCFNPSANAGRSVSRELTQFQDVDGDGFPDFLKSTKDNNLTVKRSTIARTNLLKGVKRPLGATFAVDYKRVGNTYDQPSVVWTLNSVEMNDGFEGDGADIMASSFEYEAGYYDRNERDFYGFKTVKSNQLDTQNGNAVYRTVIQEFIVSNYYEKGLLSREALLDANENIFTETLNTYQLKDITTGSILPDSFKATDTGTAFPALSETTKNYYEGQSTAGKSMRMAYTYDLLGNVTGYTDFGEPTPSDDITSTITYHSVPDKYIMNSPSGITVSANGNIYRKRATDIDTNTGNVTQIRKFLENGNIAVSDMEYDQYGNITKMIRPENQNGERMFLAYEYDDVVQTYPVQTSDAYGYSSSSEYDYRFGQMLLSTDLNGQQMRYTIDDVGRVITITGPFELAQGLPYTIAFEYHPEAETPWALTRHYDPEYPDNDLETVTFIDGLGRSLQTKKDGAIHVSPQVDDEEKVIVSGRVNFDAFGRSVENFYPVLEAKGNESAINKEYDGVTPTRTTYDVLDRVLTVTLPDNNLIQTQYGFGTDRDGHTQFRAKVTDANGIWKESFTNVRGLTTAVLESYSQGSDIWTSYYYNPVNELVEVKDDQNNLITSEFDWFGRRTKVTHPDAGTTAFEYDLTNNLTKKVTANLAEKESGITYKYDFERLVEINYPENSQNDVKYTYGQSGATYNRAGRVVFQDDATGTQEFFYNPLGAMIKNIRTIVIPDAEPLSFTTEWTYDTWNRVKEMIYPDQEKITYGYDLGGKLNSLTGLKSGTEYQYLTQLDYDKFEQRVYLSYGNGTETFYSYEEDRRRLKTMVAETADNRKMMDNVYTYDKVNNILRLQNNAEIPSSNLMGGQTEYTYEYDDLYRLTSATGSHLGSNHENRYSLKMEYNSIHSIVKKDQLHQFKGYDETEWSPRNKTTYTYDYQYNEVQPHAPVNVGEKTYTYDANGNQTGWTSDVSGQERRILWDEENRIKAIADNGELFSYVYDANNERVLKSNGGGQNVRVNGKKAGGTGSIGNYTVYVNPYVVVRNSMVTKHFYIENQRIVTKLAESSDVLLQPKTAGSSINNFNYKNKQKKLKGSILKLYADLGLEIDKVDGEAGNSGQTPPNGNAYGYGNNNGGGNNGGNPENTNGNSGGNGINMEAFAYYYHPDHLGSSSYITDSNGEVAQHIEYFAFGETFLEEHSNTERTPYLFSGKELDEETGLYYYGARYYDAKISVWQSVDPMMLREEVVLSLETTNGGVFNAQNNSVYSYSYQNPVKYVDPDGECPNCITGFIGAIVGGVIGGAIEAGTQLYENGSITDWSAVGGGAAQGALTGAAAGFTGGASLAVTAGAAGTANAVGGTVNRAIRGEDITAGGIIMDATLGAAFGVGGKYLGAGLSSLSNNASRTAANKLTDAATKVLKQMGRGNGAVYGTKAHSAFSKAVNGMKIGNNTIRTEVSYLNGQVVKHGTKGSARIDAGLYDAKGNLIHVFDLKTGGARLTPKQVQHIQTQTRSQVPVSEIRGN